MNRSLKLSLMFVAALCGIGGAAFYYKKHAVDTVSTVVNGYTISPYTPERDRAFIFNEFKSHWSYLVQTATYDIAFMLDTMSPSKHELKYMGKAIIRVLCDGARPVGFIVYYMEAPQQGRILFLDITDEYQAKKLGGVLVDYACQDLKKRGAKIVKIFTYYKNTRAQRLYKRCGFKEAEHLEGNSGLYFRKEV